MKKLTGVIALTTLIIFSAHQIAVTFNAVPPPGKTGAPGEVSCMVLGCHPSAGLKGSISVKFNNGSNVYYPDSTYGMELRLANDGDFVFGFQLTALDALEQGQGELIVTNINNTFISNSMGREYISHFNAFDTLNFGVDSLLWQFQWKAPPIAKDSIIFYFAGIAANQVISVPTGSFYMNNLGISPTAVNLAPVADDQNLTVAQDSTLLIDLTTSAYDPNGDAVSFSIINAAGNGTSIQLGVDQLQYESNPGFVGVDSILYAICDGGSLCDSGMIYIDVAVIPGFAEGAVTSSLKIYPNPFHHSTVIAFDNPSMTRHNFTLFNAAGHQVLNIDDITTEEVILKRGKLSMGVYYYQLQNTENVIGRGKLIVQ